MYLVGRQGIGRHYVSETEEAPNPELKILIKLFSPGGSLKKIWWYGQENCPILKLIYENNLHICGSGTIEFAYIDFPIDPEDYIEVYYNNEIEYRALIENSTDPKGGKCRLISYTIRLSELLYSGSFVAKTIEEILETIVVATTSDTGILWNSSYIDTGSSTTYTKEYEYETLKKIISDLISELDDRKFGVTANNFFKVYQPETTTDKILFYTDEPIYLNLKTQKNWQKIKSTRHQVYRKNTAGETSRSGQVGYGAGYPSISLETLVRKKEAKIQVSELLSDAESLDYAYAKLTSQIIPQNTKITHVDKTIYQPKIGKQIVVFDEIDEALETIIDCDSVTNWIGGTLDTTKYKEGTGSVYFSGSAAPTELIYDFNRIMHFFHPSKICFMLYTTVGGDYLEFSVGKYRHGGWSNGEWSQGAWSSNDFESSDYLWETVYPISINSSSEWVLVTIPFTISDFRYFGIRFKSAPVAMSTINIDRIQLYMYTRNMITGNIIKITNTIDQYNDRFCDIELNDYDIFLNDELFEYDNKIKRLQTIQQQ